MHFLKAFRDFLIYFLTNNCCDDILYRHADVAEWQTQQTQNLPVVTSCGFKSRHPHFLIKTPKPLINRVWEFFGTFSITHKYSTFKKIYALFVGAMFTLFSYLFCSLYHIAKTCIRLRYSSCLKSTIRIYP